MGCGRSMKINGIDDEWRSSWRMMWRSMVVVLLSSCVVHVQQAQANDLSAGTIHEPRRNSGSAKERAGVARYLLFNMMAAVLLKHPEITTDLSSEELIIASEGDVGSCGLEDQLKDVMIGVRLHEERRPVVLSMQALGTEVLAQTTSATSKVIAEELPREISANLRGAPEGEYGVRMWRMIDVKNLIGQLYACAHICHEKLGFWHPEKSKFMWSPSISDPFIVHTIVGRLPSHAHLDADMVLVVSLPPGFKFKFNATYVAGVGIRFKETNILHYK